MRIFNSKMGFTLAELVVSMAIISIMAAILLGSRNQYNERLALKNETYKVVLYLRQAQVYSMGVKGGGSPVTFNTSYGVHFRRDEPTQFRFFTDQNGDGKFPNDNSEINEIISLSNNVTFDMNMPKMGCTTKNGAIWRCYGPQGGLRQISITFKRPSSSAMIKFLTQGGDDTDPGEYNPPITIYLKSQTGLGSSIKVDSTGVVAVVGI